MADSVEDDELTAFKNECKEVLKGFTEIDPTPAIEQFENLFNSDLGQQSSARIKYFLSKVLPKALDSLLKRDNYATPTTLRRIVNFLMNTTVFCTKHLDDICDCIDAFGLLFSPDVKRGTFFGTFKDDTHIFTDEDKDMRDQALSLTNTDWDVSTHALANINVFLDAKGAETLIAKCTNQQKRVTLDEIADIIRMFGKFHDLYIQGPHVQEIIGNLWKATTDAILGMTAEELKNVEKKNIGQALHPFTKMLAEVFPSKLYEGQAKMMIDMFWLQWGLRWMKLPFLQKRVQGLTEITKQCDYYYNNIMVDDNEAKVFLEWIQKEKLVECLFGETSHHELMRRAPSVLRLLAFHRLITTAHVDIIWDAAIGKHETIMHQIWELLSTLSRDLSFDLIQYLFNKISLISPHCYDAQFIEFIKVVTESGLQGVAKTSQKSKSVFGLHLFWENIQDGVPHNPQNGAHLFQCFLHLLSLPACKHERTIYLDLCLSNIENLETVPKSWHIIQQIVSIQKGNELQVTLNWLKQRGLMDLTTQALQKYANFAMAEYQKNWSEYDANYRIFKGQEFYSYWMKQGLCFMTYMCPTIGSPLTSKQINEFWEAMIEKALTADVRDAGFVWLENARGLEGYSLISAEQSNSIFTSLFPLLDFSGITVAGFSMFEFFFRYLNWKEKKFEQMKNEFRVLSFDLLGYDLIWRLAFEAESEKVGEYCIVLLNRLQTNLHADLQKQIEDQREGYVARCMEAMTKATLAILDPNIKDKVSADRVIKRSLAALTTFLMVFEKSGSLEKHGTSGRSQLIEWTVMVVRTLPAQSGKYLIPMSDKKTLGDLRDEVGRYMELNPSKIRLICGGKELVDDKSMLRDLNVPNHQIHATTRLETSRPAPVLADSCEKMFLLPSQIMVQDKHFEQIFNLLSLPTPLCLSVWELLMKLPTNPQIKTKLKEIEENTDWGALLDSNNLYRLFYSLQIVDAILHGTNDGSLDQAWSDKFVGVGGLKHVANIFLKTDFVKSDCTKRLVCLTSLLDILNLFLIERIDKDNSKLKIEFLTPLGLPATAFIDQLLTIITSIAVPIAGEEESAQAKTIVSAMNLLICLLSAEQEGLDHFLNHPKLSEWLSTVCLLTPFQPIRKFLTEKLLKMAGASEPVRTALYLGLLQFLGPSVGYPTSCMEYYVLVEGLLRLVNAPPAGEGSKPSGHAVHFPKLMEMLIEMLKSRPIVEATSTQIQEDDVLKGLLYLVRRLFLELSELRESHGKLVLDLVFKYLFEVTDRRISEPGPGLPPPYCKTSQTRNFGFQVILVIVETSGDLLNHFCELAMSLFQNRKGYGPWEYEPANTDKAGNCGYVGLVNQGATCYMNSLMQQLFMQPDFRKRLLFTQEKEHKDESVLYQMQSLFINLQESNYKSYNALQFCNSFEVEKGKTMKTDEQMDVDEFFNTLFDRLEGALKGTNHEKLLDEMYGGQVVNQILSLECTHTVERAEPFLTLSVEVKSKFSLLQSLELFVQGDSLQGDNKYHCSACDAKVAALKRCCIKKLPRNLIVHLKRFDFDLELLRRSKINQLCEFPERLNLEPYTKEGLERRSKDPNAPLLEKGYEYELKGVLVHTGTTESGHYYSFIQDRERDNWFWFNDSKVQGFSKEMIPQECFGGQLTSQMSAYQRHAPMKVNNAYMLFYEQIDPPAPLPALELPKSVRSS